MPKTRNAFEKKLETQLKKAKVKFKYESEKIAYVLAGHYIPDFILETRLGKIYIEAKGYFRPEHKRKMIAVKRVNPNLDIRIIFYKYNKSYEKWAIRYGFRFAFENIPSEWINE